MKYNIFSSSAPAISKPEKGTEIIKFYLSQVSPEMRKTISTMPFPAFLLPIGREGSRTPQPPKNHYIGASGVEKGSVGQDY